MNTSPTRCGFIAILGAPNAGKSTLTNALVGAKIAIVTPKVQTTRNRILGITIHNNSQLILMDTPGVFQAKEKFERAMVQAALGSMGDADIVMLLVDAYKGIDENTRHILEALKERAKQQPQQTILTLNKIDKISKEALLGLTQELYDLFAFDACFMISALKGDGLDELRDWLAEALPEDAWHYPEDQMTDVPLRQLAAEITRESLFFRLQQELPYSIAVETDSWSERKDGSIEVRQTVFVQNENQKKIVVGGKGTMLKEIGQASRTRLGKFLEREVHLFLFVKVSKQWKQQKDFYDAIGLDFS